MMKMVFVLGEDFVKVADTKDVQPSHMKEVQADGKNICLVNVWGKYYAIGSICTQHGKSGSSSSPQIELTLLEKHKVEGTDVTSFKFSKHDGDDQGGGVGGRQGDTKKHHY
jgi:nitrite reductase/ring-hydroxylating ferredoxin subunit